MQDIWIHHMNPHLQELCLTNQRDAIFRIRTWVAQGELIPMFPRKLCKTNQCSWPNSITEGSCSWAWSCVVPTALPCKEKLSQQQNHNSTRAWKSPRHSTFSLNKAGEPLHEATTKWNDAQKSVLTVFGGQASLFPVPHSCSYWLYLFPAKHTFMLVF